MGIDRQSTECLITAVEKIYQLKKSQLSVWNKLIDKHMDSSDIPQEKKSFIAEQIRKFIYQPSSAQTLASMLESLINAGDDGSLLKGFLEDKEFIDFVRGTEAQGSDFLARVKNYYNDKGTPLTHTAILNGQDKALQTLLKIGANTLNLNYSSALHRQTALECALSMPEESEADRSKKELMINILFVYHLPAVFAATVDPYKLTPEERHVMVYTLCEQKLLSDVDAKILRHFCPPGAPKENREEVSEQTIKGVNDLREFYNKLMSLWVVPEIDMLGDIKEMVMNFLLIPQYNSTLVANDVVTQFLEIITKQTNRIEMLNAFLENPLVRDVFLNYLTRAIQYAVSVKQADFLEKMLQYAAEHDHSVSPQYILSLLNQDSLCFSGALVNYLPPDFKDSNDNTVLHLCGINMVSIEFFQAIRANYSGDINQRNKEGRTPLFSAVCGISEDTELARRHEAVVAALLQEPGIDVNVFANDKATPLTVSIYQKDLRVLQLLLQHRAIDVNLPGLWGAPLYVAAQKNQASFVVELLNHPKVEVNAQDEQGDTALMIAARSGSAAALGVLLADKRIDIEVKNKNGKCVATIKIAFFQKQN